MIITEENANFVKELLNVTNVPFRWIENSDWILWGDYYIPSVLPHAVFKDLYTVVESRADYKIVETL